MSDRSGRVVTGEIGKAELWELTTGRKVATLGNHEERITGTAFSADGSLISTAAKDLATQLWVAADGRLLRNLTGSRGQENTVVAFDPRRPGILATGGSAVRLWDRSSGRQLRRWNWKGRWTNAMAFASDGSEVLVAGYPGMARWNAETGAELLPQLAGKSTVSRHRRWRDGDPRG